jgi:DNA-binding GntR family transcriptional regulator
MSQPVSDRPPRAGGAPLGAAGLPAPRLGAIARETVQDRVYRELRRALIYGLFEPGHVLGIQDLADTFATSTMPVRDALGRLVSEQALEAMPNRSARVPPIDPGRLDDLLRARVVIEGAALDLAAERLTDADFAALEALNDDYAAAAEARGAVPIEAELEANRAFHFLLYRAAGSPVLLPIIESLWLQSGPCVRAAAMAFDPKSAIAAPHYHALIVTALKAGDRAAARAALAEDIGRAFAILKRGAP